MFSKNFYPTPTAVIEKMLEPYRKKSKRWDCMELRLDGLTILEPSAGKGDILDYIEEHAARYSKPQQVYCIEKHPDLQAVLREKQHKVIGEDFLTFESPYQFDLIVMNPSFDAGAAHLLKAWELLHMGDIICLLNTATYQNPHTRERQLLKEIIDANGTVEYLGDSFQQAERKTGVEVALIRLHKEGKSHFEFDATGFDTDQPLEFPDDIQGNQVEVLDVLKSYENRYKAAVDAFGQMQQAIARFRYCTEDTFISSYRIKDFVTYAERKEFNPFIQHFNEVCWNKVLDQSKFERFLTTNVRRDFSQKFQHQSKLAFTKANMLLLFEVLWQNKEDILESCIEDVFDIMTKYHHENRAHIEGWKTNDAWRVNRKVILPYYVAYGRYGSADDLRRYGSNFRVERSTELMDIDRCMAYIDAKNIEHIRSVSETLQRHFDSIGKIRTGETFDKECESTYFKIRFFKKGTIHLTFKDRYLWQEFNYRAAQRKGFPLPERVSKKKTEPQPQPETGQTAEDMTLFPALTA